MSILTVRVTYQYSPPLLNVRVLYEYVLISILYLPAATWEPNSTSLRHNLYEKHQKGKYIEEFKIILSSAKREDRIYRVFIKKTWTF